MSSDLNMSAAQSNQCVQMELLHSQRQQIQVWKVSVTLKEPFIWIWTTSQSSTHICHQLTTKFNSCKNISSYIHSSLMQFNTFIDFLKAVTSKNQHHVKGSSLLHPPHEQFAVFLSLRQLNYEILHLTSDEEAPGYKSLHVLNLHKTQWLFLCGQ